VFKDYVINNGEVAGSNLRY